MIVTVLVVLNDAILIINFTASPIHVTYHALLGFNKVFQSWYVLGQKTKNIAHKSEGSCKRVKKVNLF